MRDSSSSGIHAGLKFFVYFHERLLQMRASANAPGRFFSADVRFCGVDVKFYHSGLFGTLAQFEV